MKIVHIHGLGSFLIMPRVDAEIPDTPAKADAIVSAINQTEARARMGLDRGEEGEQAMEDGYQATEPHRHGPSGLPNDAEPTKAGAPHALSRLSKDQLIEIITSAHPVTASAFKQMAADLNAALDQLAHARAALPPQTRRADEQHKAFLEAVHSREQMRRRAEDRERQLDRANSKLRAIASHFVDTPSDYAKAV